VDFCWTGDVDIRRSIRKYVFQLFGGEVSWMSKQQVVVSLSTTEAEYMETPHACKKAIWLMKLCSEVGISHKVNTITCS
jgi:hypothetical protein